MVPRVGAAGIAGCASIITLPDDGEMHPAELVTVKVYIPSDRFETVVLVPDPGVITPPGERIRFHVPVDGNPVNNTLPVDTVHVGCVKVPTTGDVGDDDCAMITRSEDATEIHPTPLVTVYEYVPDGRPVIVILVPVPDVATPPGVRVKIHVPVAGKPLNTTLPVDKVHVGWVTFPTTGAVGDEGCALIITFTDATEMHPALVTV
jgi:uncharacterized protein YceK